MAHRPGARGLWVVHAVGMGADSLVAGLAIGRSGTADAAFDPAVPWASVGRMVDDGRKGGTRFDANHPDGRIGNRDALGLSPA